MPSSSIFRNGGVRSAAFFAVAIHKIFALIGHTVLNCDTATQGFDAFQVFVGNGFAMVEKPVQTFERDIAIDLLKNIQKARDAFVVGGVKTERPFVSSQQRYDTFQFAFQRSRKVGARFEKIFKIRRRENQHFARAVATEEIIALARPRHFDPAREIFLFLFRFLGEKVVGDAQSHFAALM